MSNLSYAWTNNKKVSDDKTKKFLDYMNRNRAYMIPIGDFIFDSRSLKSKIVLSRCLECENYQEHNCCCGNSYSMPKVNADALRSVSRDILEIIPDNSGLLDSYYKYGAITHNNSTTVKGHKDGYCIFSYVDNADNNPKCAIHKWCLSNNKNPAEYKPYICSLFPLQGIKMPNNKIVIFCSTKETDAFSMYFYTLTRRICVNEEAMIKAYSGDVGGNKYLRSLNINSIKSSGIKDDMKYSFVEQENILRFLCGDSVYDELIKKVEDI